MGIQIISIGSSSFGNSYIVKVPSKSSSQSTNILVDVGLTAKAIKAALQENEIETTDVAAVLITHEHSDHVKSIRAIARCCENAIFYASEGTINACDKFQYVPEERLRAVSSGETIRLINADVLAFNLSHDAAEPLGFSIMSRSIESEEIEEVDAGEKLTIVTDTGKITREIFEAMRDADLLVLEANHDEELLLFGEYPYSLKVRIKGDHGHLSNASAGAIIARVIAEKQATDCRSKKPLEIMLAHLSEKNNAPFYARRTVEEVLEGQGYGRGIDYNMRIAGRETPVAMYIDNL